jgi:hypothetical protein
MVPQAEGSAPSPPLCIMVASLIPFGGEGARNPRNEWCVFTGINGA